MKRLFLTIAVAAAFAVPMHAADSSDAVVASLITQAPGLRPKVLKLALDAIFAQGTEIVLDELLPRYVGTRLYQAALESTASFFSSQMVAMKNATENADELIEDLTLSYNKARQANITRELIEIASGAQSR